MRNACKVLFYSVTFKLYLMKMNNHIFPMNNYSTSRYYILFSDFILTYSDFHKQHLFETKLFWCSITYAQFRYTWIYIWTWSKTCGKKRPFLDINFEIMHRRYYLNKKQNFWFTVSICMLTFMSRKFQLSTY